MSGADAAPAPEVIDQVWNIPLDLVEVGDRVRPIDPLWAAALGRIMATEGQRTPIEVCRLPGSHLFRLVAGAHRLEGHRLEGMVSIKAIVVSNDALDRRLSEVSENLWRKELGPLDRAAFVAELHDLLRVKAGIAPDVSLHQVAANRRWKKEADDASRTMRQAYGWAEEAARRLQMDRATVYRDLQLHRGLKPDVVTRLNSLSIAPNGGQLRALAKLSDADQRRAVNLIAEGKAKGFGEAVAIVENRPKPTAEAKRLNAFIGAFARMSAKEQKAALQALSGLKLPKGWTVSDA